MMLMARMERTYLAIVQKYAYVHIYAHTGGTAWSPYLHLRVNFVKTTHAIAHYGHLFRQSSYFFSGLNSIVCNAQYVACKGGVWIISQIPYLLGEYFYIRRNQWPH